MGKPVQPERPPAAAAEAVTPAARRFLRPLVGIAPGEVEVRRGPEAEAIAERHQADAVTRGETIEMGSPAPEQSPEGLGLLAHELTLVARAREPRFVPPVLRDPEAGRAAVEAQPARPGRLAPAAAPSRAAPGRAAPGRVAPGRVAPMAPVPPTPAAVGEPEEAIAEEVEATVRRLARPQGEAAPPAQARRPAAERWSDVPAPGEPLPDLGFEAGDEAVSDDGGGETVGVAGVAPDGGASHLADLAGGRSAAAESAGVQRAARGRAVEEEGSPGGAAEGEKPGGPDVEALARQVYGILKRRLAAERRRGG